MSPQYGFTAEFVKVLKVHEACGNVFRIEKIRISQERVKGSKDR